MLNYFIILGLIGAAIAAHHLDGFLWTTSDPTPYTVEDISPKTSHQKILLGHKIDINSATRFELDLLPGIGTKMASMIISYRETHGRFNRADDLKKVWGIGPAKLKKLHPFITAE